MAKLALFGLALRLILAGIDNRKEVKKVAEEYGVDFSRLWEKFK